MRYPSSLAFAAAASIASRLLPTIRFCACGDLRRFVENAGRNRDAKLSQNELRLLHGGRISDRRSRSDHIQIVADHIGQNQRQHASPAKPLRRAARL